MLTSIFVPSMILNLLPFIIFVSSMLYMIKLRNNKDLLTLKVNGFSNLKIFYFCFYVFFYWVAHSNDYKSNYIIDVTIL